ncbi:MAG TPA: SPW repeat protein [Streptomyces sp.]|nr:SPW repeat protein [Streptomyces sp.]
MARTPHFHDDTPAPARPRLGARIARLRFRDRITTVLTALAAVWTLVSAWVLGHPFTEGTAGAHRSQWLAVGVVVLLAALFCWFRPLRHSWASGLVLLAGLWLAVSPLVFGYGADGAGAARVSGLVTGLALVFLGLLGLLLSRRAARAARHLRPAEEHDGEHAGEWPPDRPGR